MNEIRVPGINGSPDVTYQQIDRSSGQGKPNGTVLKWFRTNEGRPPSNSLIMDELAPVIARCFEALDEIMMSDRRGLDDDIREIAARALGLEPCPVCGRVGTVPDCIGNDPAEWPERACPNEGCVVGFVDPRGGDDGE